MEEANGTVSGYAQYIGSNGKALSTGGAPTLGISWDPEPQLSTLHLVQGSPPTTPHDVVMDLGTAQKYNFKVGQQVRVLLQGPTQTFTITGLARFGTADNLAGATLAAFDIPTAQRLLGEVGKFDSINIITTPNANQAQVQRSIAAAVPRDVEVVTGQTVINEATSAIGQALGFFNTALLVFAFISLFVGGFTILNTFSIIVGQRTKELALLRIVGASRRQVFRSVLGEAAIVGLVSSLIGLGLGVLAAIGLEALLKGFGVTLPSGPIAFEPRTVIVCLVVGVGVTVVSAISPARRAVRIAPVEAVSEQQGEHEISMRRRFTWGAAITLLGALALAVGLTKPAIQLVGLGALLIFVGVARLAPAVARPMSSVIGRPLARLLGMSGRLGRENSMRSPRRTAQTASALMVGLALVSVIAVFGASVSQSATASIDQAIAANIIVSNANNNGPGAFSTTVPAAVAGVPGVTSTSTVYGGQFEFKQSIVSLRGITTKNLSQTLILTMSSGTPQALAAGNLLIDTSTANSDHLSVGDRVPVKFALTGNSTMRIGGIFQTNQLIGSFLVSQAFYVNHFQNPQPNAVLARTDGSAGVEQARQAGPRLVPQRPGAEPGRVREVPIEPGEPVAGPGLRASRPGHPHRADRHCEHAHALGVRANPRDRAAAGRRDETPAGPGDDPLRVGDPGRVRRGHRDHRGHVAGHRPGLVAALTGDHQHRGAAQEPRDLPDPGRPARIAGGELAGAAGRPAGRPGGHRGRIERKRVRRRFARVR